MPELFEILFGGEKDKRRTEIHRELKMEILHAFHSVSNAMHMHTLGHKKYMLLWCIILTPGGI